MHLPEPIYNIKPYALGALGIVSFLSLHPIGKFGGVVLILTSFAIIFLRRQNKNKKWIKGKYAETRIK